MITLCLGIIFVYILLFQVKGKALQPESITHTWGDLSIWIRSGEEVQTLSPIPQINNLSGLQANTWSIQQTQYSWSQIQNPLLTKSTTSGDQKTGLLHILSGTNVFYGNIPVIEKLGIKYAYALVDQQNTYYINLGNPTYEFSSIAKKLGGSLYELKTEAEISQNKLFGDKITFINLPEYKDKKVVMIIVRKGESRLIWIDYAQYHKSKSYIKSLFIQ